MKNAISKKTVYFFLTAMLFSITVLSGCTGRLEPQGSKGSSGERNEQSTTSYEHVFRDVGEQKYITPAESFSGGNGTETNPYQISTAAELALLSEVYEIYSETHNPSDERVAPYYQAYYILTDDIVLNEYPDGEDWSKTAPEYAWLPIGFNRWFEGSFDGDGHTITGMYINADKPYTNNGSGESYGLFGENMGVIKNVNLEKSYICVSGYSSYVGGIAGTSGLKEEHAIENCSVSANIYCYDADCGGVVGNNRGSVKGCSFDGNVICLREDTVNGNVGGIVGYNSGKAIACVNSGAVTSMTVSLGGVGGIVGAHHGGEVRECENTGTVTGGDASGGIAGRGFLSDVGGKSAATQADIVNCNNSGAVYTEGAYAGGIVGDYDNRYSDYIATVSGCENSGSVKSSGKIGGIIGLINLQGDVNVSNCTNTASLSGHTVGGIIGAAYEMFGSLTVTGCHNSAEITGGGLYGAGIIAENNLMSWNDSSNRSLNVMLSACENTGKINTLRGGGIAGVFVNSISAESVKSVSVTLEGDVNNAEIHCLTNNAFVGGIVGNIGVPNGEVTVKNCRTSGTISFEDNGVDYETTGEKGAHLELSRIGGGIVGMIDSGIFLATNGDGITGNNINAPDAKIVFTGCHSDMVFDAPDADRYTYDDGSGSVFLNRFGGIIGFCTDNEGYAFRVEKCTYTNCDRGLGIEGLLDVGRKE